MSEFIVSGIGIGIAGFIAILLFAAMRSDEMKGCLLLGLAFLFLLDSMGLLYFLVRFVRWCWLTPTPFAGV